MQYEPEGKRAVDLVLATLGLALTAPVILIAALAIRLTSPGPAVFAQTRLGRNEAPFRCLKLRTMAAGTLSLPTHEVAASAITPLGHWLRRCKIDELPQLWNVLCGEMSLVGPRPCLPEQAALIAARRRGGVFSVRPGISGLAQVRGIDMSAPDRCAASDADYAAQPSLARDLHILAATVVSAVPRP